MLIHFYHLFRSNASPNLSNNSQICITLTGYIDKKNKFFVVVALSNKISQKTHTQ